MPRGGITLLYGLLRRDIGPLESGDSQVPRGAITLVHNVKRRDIGPLESGDLRLQCRLHRVGWRELRSPIACVNSNWFSARAVSSGFLALAS